MDLQSSRSRSIVFSFVFRVKASKPKPTLDSAAADALADDIAPPIVVPRCSSGFTKHRLVLQFSTHELSPGPLCAVQVNDIFPTGPVLAVGLAATHKGWS